jgi:L-malate glycosyltransferase
MRIGIACYPSHGGSGVVASELALGLARRGHEIHIISFSTPFRLSAFHENVFIHEVEVASYPLFKDPPFALALATKMVDVAREYRLDLIHSHYAIPFAASAYLARQILAPVPLRTVTTLHGTDITLVGLDKSFFSVCKFAMEQSDGLTAVSHYLRDKTIEEFQIQRDISVIHNFVDTVRYNPDRQNCIRGHYASPEEKILMHASNFRPVKRVADTVRVLARILPKVPAKLLLVGEGPERLFVQQLVRELKLTKQVLFLGQQDYLEKLMACADLFLLPSEMESFGLVALEAHACGVPVVASRTGGVPEVVRDGETGYLTPVGEIGEMADRAERLLTDPELHKRFSQNARRTALERFPQEQILPQYEELYAGIMGS